MTQALHDQGIIQKEYEKCKSRKAEDGGGYVVFESDAYRLHRFKDVQQEEQDCIAGPSSAA